MNELLARQIFEHEMDVTRVLTAYALYKSGDLTYAAAAELAGEELGMFEYDAMLYNEEKSLAQKKEQIMFDILNDMICSGLITYDDAEEYCGDGCFN